MKKTFNMTITSEHPIIQGHNIHGKRLLPGLAYIDILYQILHKAMGLDYKKYTLKRLSIYNPLAINEGDSVELKFNFEQVPDYWKVNVEGIKTGGTGNVSQNIQYVTAEFHQEDADLTEILKPEEIKLSDSFRIDMKKIYGEAAERGMCHQGMIKAEGAIYHTEQDCLIEVEVGKDYVDMAKSFIFNPALIDGAALATAYWESTKNQGNDEELFLPLYYDKFYASKALNTECYARVNIASVHQVNDIRTTDIAFFDEAGKQIALLKGITAKQIRDKSHINYLSKSETSSSMVKNTPIGSELIQTDGTKLNCKESEIIAGKANSSGLHFIEIELQQIFSRHIGVLASKVDVKAGYYEAGLQSSQLLAVEQDIEKAFGLALSPTLLFEYANISELAEYLMSFPELHTRFLSVKDAADMEMTEKSNNKFNENNKASEEFVEQIAIIGLTGRYPKAKNIQELWENLQEGRDCVTEIPKERWDYEQYHDEDRNKLGKVYCKWGGFIEDVDKFDPLFFQISPMEAALMDPQERLFLETVWHVLENAGYTRETIEAEYHNRVGVFVGATHQHYNLETLIPESISSIANRVSFFFNFQGPSIAVDTMCSSSTNAIHLACESLKRGECEMAIAGGVNLTLHPKKYLGLCLTQMLGSHPNSRSFSDGDGFIPAECIGAVLLKPLSKAIKDKDSILAVIKATSVNQRGQANGYTAPNPNSQALLYEENLNKAGVNPRTISYVEAASMGQPVGDPIELIALTKAFRKYTKDNQFCAIGSVKSNIGHGEAASGISQLTKVVLQLNNKMLVPSIKAEPLNPNINFNNTPFYLQQNVEQWERPVINIDGERKEFPRRATVFSFGAGGSNAHIIVEEYIPDKKQFYENTEAIPQIAVFSAKSRDRLIAVLEQGLCFIEDNNDISLSNLAYTLQVGREAMDFRLAVVATTIEELINGLYDSLTLMKENGDRKYKVPIFRGEMQNSASDTNNQALRQESEIRSLIQNKSYEEIAQLWSGGIKIPWEIIHEGEAVFRISLPGYPFIKRSCWAKPRAKWELIDEQDGLQGDFPENYSLQDKIIELISRLTGMEPYELSFVIPMVQYGVNMITLNQVMKYFKINISSKDSEALSKCRTIQELTAFVADKINI